jgi:TRAP-type uncharacterized transport system substrate-binding protein
MSMVSPTIYRLMQNGKAMYAKEPEAPELSKNVQLLMWFPYGQYHYTVRAGSDIETLDDIEGASVFLGPAGGGAYNTAKGWIEATTGLVAGEDYEAITANWATGYQSFLRTARSTCMSMAASIRASSSSSLPKPRISVSSALKITRAKP